MEQYSVVDKKFINPYNFISINEKPVEKIDAEGKKECMHTGRIHCSLTVKTPLAIPDVENVQPDSNVRDHKIYSAFKIDGHLAIPGSSIRGMLRSVYEAATNSCMSTIDPNEHITKRSDLGKFSPCVSKSAKQMWKPCVLKFEKHMWKLYDAERIALVCDGNNYSMLPGNYTRYTVQLDNKEKYIKVRGVKLYFGQEVQITIKKIGHEKIDRKTGESKEVWGGQSVNTINDGKSTNCYLYLGEATSNKHAESVFRAEKVNNTSVKDNDIKRALKGLEETIKMYRSDSINRNLSSEKPKEKHYGYYGYERAKKNGVIPLWYKCEGTSLKLSMAAIGRISFDNDMAKISNGHAPCVSRKQLCPACALFGMLGNGKDNNGLGSRIRVTDAIAKENVEPTPNVTLKELGSPRTSYLKFYSVGGLGYDDTSAQIRGRKFYWHIPAACNDNSIYSTTEKTNRNATFELINVGSQFEFDVYYDEVDEEQLKMLLWILQLPNDLTDGKTLMHKLGHGKPLGLGSVELKVITNTERKCSGGYEIAESAIKVSNHEKLQLLNDSAWKKLTNMLEYNPNSKANISYPKILLSQNVKGQIDREHRDLNDNVAASHQWFRLNCEQLPDDRSGMPLWELSRVVEKDFKKKYNGVQSKKQNPSTSTPKVQYKIDQPYLGEVTGHNKSGKFANVKLKNGGKASFYDGGKVEEHTEVRLMYKGKDDKGYDSWSLVRQK